MAYDIVTIGPILCEIMRKELDKPLGMIADFIGPYPSGDTPIMINAAAKLGAKCAMIGVIGKDDFGHGVVKRLEESGVDCSMVHEQPGASTGVAFVCYYSDGSRKFLYHVRHAAPGMLNPDHIDPDKLKDVRWVHITGFTMSTNKSSENAVLKLVANLHPSTQVSFDPNIRPEVLSVEEIIQLCKPVIDRASIIFPSKTEAAMFTGKASDEEGCRQWAAEGKVVVLKEGEAGCRIFHQNDSIRVPSFRVEEVDPTGAGDTFCGAFLAALCEGKDLATCGRMANAAGAISVLKQGPMEGAPTRAELDAFLKKNA